MLPQIPHSFDFIHFRDRSDLPHLFLVVILVLGIVLGSYLALQPQLFNKKAAGGGLVDMAFVPDSMQIQPGKIYEAKIEINPKGHRVTALQMAIDYDPAVVTIIEAKNEGFLPVVLKVEDDFAGRLNVIYGSTIESQPDKAGTVTTIKFKANASKASAISLAGNTLVAISTQETNALSVFPELKLVPGGGTKEDLSYPQNLPLEEVVHQESGPFVNQFKEGLEPLPEIKPQRVKPAFSEAYIKQLGSDIFIEPVVALNEVIQEKAGEIIK